MEGDNRLSLTGVLTVVAAVGTSPARKDAIFAEGRRTDSSTCSNTHRLLPLRESNDRARPRSKERTEASCTETLRGRVDSCTWARPGQRHGVTVRRQCGPMALVKQFSCGSLFSDDGNQLGPEHLDDAAFVDDTMDMDQDLGEDATFQGLCVGPQVACPELSMDGATSAWEAQRCVPSPKSLFSCQPRRSHLRQGIFARSRAARRLVLDRQMSTEAFGSTQELYASAPPVSPPVAAGGDAWERSAPIMIPTQSLMRTDCLHSSWGTHSADVFAVPEDPQQTWSAEQEDDSMDEQPALPASYCHREHREGVVNAAGLWSQIYEKARPLARSVAASAPGPRASDSPQIQGQQYKKRRVVPKDRPKPKPWSEHELQHFRSLVKREGANNWGAKAEKLGTGRSAKSLHTRWLREEGRIIDRPRTVAAMAMNAQKAAAAKLS